ncbi:MAG: hypothetical protein ACOC38_06025 [Promethearchaeia archaeon]
MVICMLALVVMPHGTSSTAMTTESVKQGPFLDKIVFEYPHNYHGMIGGLLDDEIQVVDDVIQ